MNDDYLWDASGEPDPDVQRLEQVLGHYRYQPRPLSPALTSRFTWQRRGWLRFAAAAAVILMVLAGFWIFKVQQKRTVDQRDTTATINAPEDVPRKEIGPLAPSGPVAPDKSAERGPLRKTYHRAARRDQQPPDSAIGNSNLVAERQPIMIPFIDLETARHLEQAQLMLRSFRNSRESNAQTDPDLAYEKQQSKGLLYKNIVLRRDAEAKGNQPAENLLSTLEPFLLDIANLPDRPTTDEVRSIKERMQKKEIVSALQIYSAPVLSQSL
ncbi:MAG TPA: hypothetical protein VLM38_21085 [Blastocatellia bacterium]|nr:hypothetical protein [Blastocatellia bacterium]